MIIRRTARLGLGLAAFLAVAAIASPHIQGQGGGSPRVSDSRDATRIRHWTGDALKAIEPVLAGAMTNGKATQPLGAFGGSPYRMVAARKEANNGPPEFHKRSTDIVLVVSGQGTMIGGGALVDAKQLTATEWVGSSISNGETFQLRPGDLVHIPPNTPHQILVNSGQHIFYITFKIDVP